MLIFFTQVGFFLEYLKVQSAVAAILAADSAARLEEAQALAGTWDGEKRPVSKYESVFLFQSFLL